MLEKLNSSASHHFHVCFTKAQSSSFAILIEGHFIDFRLHGIIKGLSLYRIEDKHEILTFLGPNMLASNSELTTIWGHHRIVTFGEARPRFKRNEPKDEVNTYEYPPCNSHGVGLRDGKPDNPANKEQKASNQVDQLIESEGFACPCK